MLAATFLFALALAAPAAVPAPQSADIHHCIAADGDLLYTDKACAALGARDLADDGLARGPFMPAYRSGCIRSLREFAYALSSAIEVGDVNRLAALYRWKGTSTRAGYEIMDRLEEIAGRPLLMVEPVYPAPPAAPAAAPAPTVPAPTMPAAAMAAAAATTLGGAATTAATASPLPPAVPRALPPAELVFAAGPSRGPPVALRLDQTLANGVTPAATTLRLARESGCWWVSL
jgi:hypothetical protein